MNAESAGCSTIIYCAYHPLQVSCRAHMAQGARGSQVAKICISLQAQVCALALGRDKTHRHVRARAGQGRGEWGKYFDTDEKYIHLYLYN